MLKDNVNWTKWREDKPKRLVIRPTKGDEMSKNKPVYEHSVIVTVLFCVLVVTLVCCSLGYGRAY